jgi:hypothetical protein
MGDFNFDSTWKQEQSTITDNGFTDVYLDLHYEESPSMAKTPKYSPWRPDKVIMPSNGSIWKPSQIEIFGKFSIP